MCSRMASVKRHLWRVSQNVWQARWRKNDICVHIFTIFILVKSFFLKHNSYFAEKTYVNKKCGCKYGHQTQVVNELHIFNSNILRRVHLKGVTTVKIARLLNLCIVPVKGRQRGGHESCQHGYHCGLSNLVLTQLRNINHPITPFLVCF